jgi:hypothetical protein
MASMGPFYSRPATSSHKTRVLLWHTMDQIVWICDLGVFLIVELLILLAPEDLDECLRQCERVRTWNILAGTSLTRSELAQLRRSHNPSPFY